MRPALVYLVKSGPNKENGSNDFTSGVNPAFVCVWFFFQIQVALWFAIPSYVT